ncbi:hypothetical protein DYB37_001099 [Aphanomyces astaci]|uniref:Amino acid permease/ SLC12A domain-containing protein n=1 Tax=Aphanomyces astaci TaxID=112090 RepID=A0A3R7AHL3_APHAT|nr:hypothetical protein DYB37_001099 [Aphanomyces astaci]
MGVSHHHRALDLDDSQHAYTPFLSLTQRESEATTTKPSSVLNQLGTFNGVYVPCLLNIIGVILFLRLGWAIGQAGVLGMLTIFFFAELQAVLTVLSASAIASNGAMRGGGSYYLISRSLGPEFGGAIGVQFYLLYASGVAMYLVGFAEEVAQTWFVDSAWGKKWVVVTVASTTLVTIVCIALIGAHAFSKVNQYLFVVQFACIAYGAVRGYTCTLVVFRLFTVSQIVICVSTTRALESGGHVTGPQSSTLAANMHANYTDELHVCGDSACDLGAVYAIVFPLATGFMEGLNLSGDLKHPGKSIPVGSLAAVVTACVIYISLIFLFGASFDGVALRTNFSFFQQVGPTPYIIITGILVSCYTSGLGALFGASRILQAIARDNLFYGFGCLGQGSAHGDEPQYAVAFTALLSFVFIFIGDLDVLAPICTSFFCVAYAAVNFTSLVLQVTGVPNFRPTFRYSCWPLSLAGVVLNLSVMIYLNAMYAAVTLVIVTALFVYLYLVGPETSWGNVSQALIYHQVRKYLLRLDTRKGHLKFWRPAILFVPPTSHAPSVALCNRLKKGGLYIVGDIVLGEFGPSTTTQASRRLQRWLDVIDDANLKAIPQNVVVFRHCDKVDAALLVPDAKHSWVRPPRRLWRLDGVVRTVDVWITEPKPWSGTSSHVTLMLQLAHVLQSNVQWKGLPIRLVRVCDDGNDESAEHLIHVASELRIALHPTHALLLPMPGGGAAAAVEINRLVRDHSRDAALVVMPLADPTVSQPDEFAATIEVLTNGLPPTMMVWSADGESVITTCI